MKNYADLLRKILDEGQYSADRTGVGTVSLFGQQLRFDMSEGFPLATGKETNFEMIKNELAWFLSGLTNINDLDSSIWDSWRSQYTVPREIVEVEPRVSEYEPYAFDLLGVPVAGYSIATPKTLEDRLARTWRNMMHRCYDTTHQAYNQYGARGISVCKRWHQVSSFIKDVQSLPHWWYKEGDWDSFQLDKDYYSSNQYSPDTCVWLRQDENNIYEAQPIQATNCFGGKTVYLTQTDCARAVGVTPKNIWAAVQHGKALTQGDHLGWVFSYHIHNVPLRYALIPEGEMGKIYSHNWRNLETGDQIAQLIADLKSNPESRRHVVTSWIPESNKTAALPACHTLFQCYVRNGRLSLQMYQRSADMFLGVPFNIASYGLLLELLAYECGLVADELIITLGDCHIYDNHMEQVAEYLKRGRRELPTLLVHASDTCAATFNVELLGYWCGDKIPAPVAV